MKYQTADRFIDNYSNIQFDALGINDRISFVKPFLEESKVYLPEGKFSGYSLWDSDGNYLSSSYEIEFSVLLKKYDIIYKTQIHYKDSKMRCDFYIPKKDIYIEIAPWYNKKGNEEYTNKMNMKAKNFNAFILVKPKEYETFIKENLL